MNPRAAGRSRRAARDRLNAELLRLPAVGNSRRPRARGGRDGLDLVRRRERRASIGPRVAERHHRAGRRRSGRTGTTSASTAGSSSPRDGTCGILCGRQESGDDVSSSAPPAPRRGRRCRDPRGALKVGIVSPYGYPHPGGVNEHVRTPYEAHAAHGPRRVDHHQQVRHASARARATSSASGPAGRSRPTAAWAA